MSGEDTSTSRNNNGVPYDYGDKNAESGKVPKFNGDPEEFSWWITNFYSYVMGLDEELLDILEDGVGDLVLDEEGDAIDRKKHTPEQKKLYKKHHKIRGSLVTAIPKAEYMKMSDKSTAKAMFASLCANYEWSKKVKNKSSFACLLVWVVQNERWWKYWANVLKISNSSFWTSNTEEKLCDFWPCEQDTEKLTCKMET